MTKITTVNENNLVREKSIEIQNCATSDRSIKLVLAQCCYNNKLHLKDCGCMIFVLLQLLFSLYNSACTIVSFYFRPKNKPFESFVVLQPFVDNQIRLIIFSTGRVFFILPHSKIQNLKTVQRFQTFKNSQSSFPPRQHRVHFFNSVFSKT